MGIRSIAKQIQSFFDKSSLTLSRDVRADANPLSQSALFNLRDAVVLFCLPRTFLGPVL